MMRTFLLEVCPYLLPVIFLFHLCFTVLFFRRYRAKRETICLWMGLLTLGLCLDAGVLALGAVVKEGTFLMSVSRLRYLSQGVLIPLLLPICAEALDFGKKPRLIVWILTAALMIVGLAGTFVTVLEPKKIAGVCRYAVSDATPSWARMFSRLLSFGTVIPLILTGIALIVKKKSPALFLGGFLMFVFSALAPATGNADLSFFVSMFGEVCMVLGIWLFAAGKRK
jgi:hypothetical protein